MLHHSSRSSILIVIDFTYVQYTVCIHTRSDIWMPETEISDHKFPFCPSAPHSVTLGVSSRNEIKGGTNHNFVKFPGQNNKYCLFLAIKEGYFTPIPPPLWRNHGHCDVASYMHSPHIHRSCLAPLDLTLRQVGATGGHFLDVYNTKIVLLARLSRAFIFKQFMSAERREHASCNEHKLVSRDRQFPWCLSCCFWSISSLSVSAVCTLCCVARGGRLSQRDRRSN
jgi:hypothetical protein